MHPPYQRRQDMRAGGIEIVVRSIKIGRHGRDETVAKLARAALRIFQSGNLGDGIGLVGRLQRAGQQGILGEWLGGVARIDAA